MLIEQELTGRVKNGHIELDQTLDWPEGTAVALALFQEPMSALAPEARAQRERDLDEFIAKAHAEGRRILVGHWLPASKT